MSAYDTFADAANTGALKVVLYGPKSTTARADQTVAAAVAWTPETLSDRSPGRPPRPGAAVRAINPNSRRDRCTVRS